ncbi:MAG: aminotransferase class V-fold PLP-dependent enzyme [Anaerolineaceae bacterium]|nr:MAG: aminotransferase class V-fold PLP-dependent enzyme [Anaerolineaceae bacterium]
MDNLKSEFMLDPEVTFLNHGSFGACPRPVFETYQEWQRELERQPVKFLARRARELMAEARTALADFLHCSEDEVVYFTNPTTAINMVARSLELEPGDEILTTDHEYGAMDRTWRFICQQIGARYVRQPIPLPVTTPEDFMETFFSGISPRTRLVFISHITSPTALCFPVEAICHRARQLGLLSIVDGAHAPGQVPLDLTRLGADLYTGACHKWLCAPKGAAFLYARREVQERLRPLVISWGWEAENPSDSRFIDHHEWQGTRDIAAFLSVPAAIRFQQDRRWNTIRQGCNELASKTRERINSMTGFDPLCPDTQDWFIQMFAARLPELDCEAFQRQLHDEHRVEVAVYRWNDQPLIRVSFQAYNDEGDAGALLHALSKLLPKNS